jgi:hypothetical protein
MPLPGFYNDNAARSYPLVPWSNALLGAPVAPLASQVSNWNAASVVVTPGQWSSQTDAASGRGYWLSLSPSAAGAGSVTWPFAVVPGRQYRVSATWPAAANRAPDAHYTITETEGQGQGYYLLMDVRVDQRIPPSQHIAFGTGWYDLGGTVAPVRNTLLVALDDDTAAPAAGDAIWVEDITPADTVTPATIMPPLDTLIDFGCLVGLDAEFDSSSHVVYLHRITRAGSTFTFDFRSDAPGLLDYALVFSRHLTDVEYATDYAGATPVGGSQGPQDGLWEGFLVTGPMASLAAMLPTDGVLAATTGPQIEPALVQNLGRSYVRSINLANQDRTHATPPADCPGGGDSGADYPYVIAATGMVGDIRFVEGYNISIRQNARNSSLTFMSVQGAGDGVPCEEVPVYPGEKPPAGSELLSGGPACDEVINSINGLTASLIQLIPGLGVSIVVPPGQHNTLNVNLDRHDMTICGAITTVVEELEEPADG